MARTKQKNKSLIKNSIDELINKIQERKVINQDTIELEKRLAEKKKELPDLYKALPRKGAKGGMIRKYNIGGFIARGCGKVMDNRRKTTKCY